jgi:hypothetical protein
LAYFFSVYIILPENTHQYLFTAADRFRVKSSGISWSKILSCPELSRFTYRQLPFELPFISNDHADVINIGTSVAST